MVRGEGKYETLQSLFELTDTFNDKGIKLLHNLKDAVWSKLKVGSSSNEIKLIQRYDNMLQEFEILLTK